MKLRRLFATACAVAAICCAATAPAQEPHLGSQPRIDAEPLADSWNPAAGEAAAADREPVERVPMFQTPGLGSPSGSAARRSRPSVAELRQARAQFRARQRMARIEARKWRGYEPLRPHWNAVPMMSSRYTARRVIQVPVYVPAR